MTAIMEQLSLLKVLVFALALYSAQAACGDWDNIGTSCYKISTDFMNFKAATDYCAKESGHVVTLESSKESADVYDYALKNKVSDWWVGIANPGVENKWFYANNGKPVVYTDWAEGEPNNGDSKWEEDCAVGMFRNGTGWTDVKCDWPMYVICEKSMPTS